MNLTSSSSVSNLDEAAALLCADILGAMKSRSDRPLIYGIDGRAASGKSSLATVLKKQLEAESKKENQLLHIELIHLDDYFLQPSMRSKERLVRPGQNVDSERIVREILEPARRGESLHIQPWSCSKQKLLPAAERPVPDILILEGSYSHNEDLNPWLHDSCFLSCSPAIQKARIEKRNGPDRLHDFETRWIPLEEFYIERLHPQRSSSRILETDSWFPSAS